MFEKARIHRAMLRLSEVGPFTTTDLERETAAAAATVRKNLTRDQNAGYVRKIGTRDGGGRAGPPEKLFQLTEGGRAQLAAEVDAAYAVLQEISHTSADNDADEPAALAAARETLADIDAPDVDRQDFSARLRIAQAELAAAGAADISRASVEEITRLSRIVADAQHELAALPDGTGAFVWLRRSVGAKIVEKPPAVPRRDRPFLDRLTELLPSLRAYTVRFAQSSSEAEVLVEGALERALANRRALRAHSDLLGVLRRLVTAVSGPASWLPQAVPPRPSPVHPALHATSPADKYWFLAMKQGGQVLDSFAQICQPTIADLPTNYMSEPSIDWPKRKDHPVAARRPPPFLMSVDQLIRHRSDFSEWHIELDLASLIEADPAPVRLLNAGDVIARRTTANDAPSPDIGFPALDVLRPPAAYSVENRPPSFEIGHSTPHRTEIADLLSPPVGWRSS